MKFEVLIAIKMSSLEGLPTNLLGCHNGQAEREKTEIVSRMEAVPPGRKQETGQSWTP